MKAGHKVDDAMSVSTAWQHAVLEPGGLIDFVAGRFEALLE